MKHPENKGRMSSAEAWRFHCGLPLDKAALTLRICPSYLRQIERGLVPPYNLAKRMAQLYDCPIQAFLDLVGR